ncbi:MAG: hypothetical protein ACUVQ5_04820 [Candidatus Methanomethylicaceae archaeon]
MHKSPKDLVKILQSKLRPSSCGVATVRRRFIEATEIGIRGMAYMKEYTLTKTLMSI